MKINYMALLAILFIAGLNTANAQSPVISSLSPLTGPVGSTVTIAGSGFNSTKTNNVVFFGSVKAIVATASPTQLTVTVPAGLSYEPVTVLNTATTLAATSTLPFNTTFSTNMRTPPSTNVPVNYSIFRETRVGDIDGDGMPDLVTMDFNNNQVKINRNTTVAGSDNVTFASHVTFAAGERPDAFVIADITGDGKPDLTIGGSATQKITFLVNTSVSGTIAFAPLTQITLSEIQYANIGQISVGDIDGDGKPDLAVAQGSKVVLLRNTFSGSSISFAPEVNITGVLGVQAIKLADFDGDGKPDIIAADNSDNVIYVARNQATAGSITAASFTFPKIIARYGPLNIQTADFDGDGKLDVLLPGRIMRNTTTGSVISFAAPITSYGEAVGDIDGDGKPDLVTYDQEGKLLVYKNITTGSSISFVVKRFPVTILKPSLADVNADGKMDLISSGMEGFSASSIKIFLNDPAVPQSPVITNISPQSGQVGATVTLTGSNFNTVEANNLVYFGAAKAQVTAASATQLTVKVPKGATLAPVNVLNTSTHLTGFSVRPFNVTYSQAKPEVLRSDFDNPVTIGGSGIFYAKDLNGDGKPEIISGEAIYQNNSTSGSISASSFTRNTFNLPTQYTITGIHVYDIDNDSKQDILICGATIDKNYVTILHNKGSLTTPSFAAPIDIIIGNTQAIIGLVYPNSISATDMDGDGRAEIVVGGIGPIGEVGVLQNFTTPGNVTASAFKILKFPVRPNGLLGSGVLKIADIDEDGRPDLVTVFESDRRVNISNTFQVLQNKSVPGLIILEREDFPISPNPIAKTFTIGDIEGDGKPDVIVASFDEKLSLSFNRSVNGDIIFNPNNVSIPYEIASLVTADINGDGKHDFFNPNGGSSDTYVFTNKYTGNITPSSFKRENMQVRVEPGAFFIDIDGDGFSDMVGNDGNLVIMRYNPQFPSLTAATAADVVAGSAVSPNGDGVNDVFTINGIEKYPDNKVTITNSRGATVFQAVGYNNTGKAFDGVSTRGIRQEAGTYFYTLEYKDKGVSQRKSGFIVLKY